jgi:putative hydrolase of the HAD superfamily
MHPTVDPATVDANVSNRSAGRGQDDDVNQHLDARHGRDIDAAIFDLGGVLMHNGRQSDLVSRFPPEHADRALSIFMGDYAADTDHPWHRLERGEISFADFQQASAAAFTEAGIAMPARPEPAPGDTSPSIAFRPNEAMMDLVARLRSAGIRVGILTNNVREFRVMWRGLLPYEELFDDIVDSHEVGLRKPNPAIYELALTRLSARSERTVFLDDVSTNVAAAVALGLYGVLVDVDATPAIAAVERLAGLD